MDLIADMIKKTPELRNIDITIGTTHRFQGDEKDIIIFSPAISQGIKQTTLNWIHTTTQLLNVAITRARSVLMIIGDKKKCNEAGGFLKSLLEYTESKKQLDINFDSPIEEKLFKKITQEGVKVIPQLATAGVSFNEGKYVKDHWFLTTRQKNIYKAKKKLSLIASRLNLSKIIETDAYMIFKSAVEKNLNVGRDNDTMLYGCVYTSCLMHEIPKTALEITAFTQTDKNKMLKAYKILKSKLNLNFEPINPIDLVQRFGTRLELKQTTISIATQIINKLTGAPVIAGKNPKTIVATALYIATKMNDDYRTQRDISNTIGIIEVTLRKRTREIMRFLNI